MAAAAKINNEGKLLENFAIQQQEWTGTTLLLFPFISEDLGLVAIGSCMLDGNQILVKTVSEWQNSASNNLLSLVKGT